MKLDQIDLNIIEELKKDSRLSMRELGRKIKLSPPSVTERVRRLESFGIIKQYTLEVDQKSWGFRFLHCGSNRQKRGLRAVQKLYSNIAEYRILLPDCGRDLLYAENQC